MSIMVNLPKKKIVMSFSMLLNLVGSSNADGKEILWKFINRFYKNVNPKINPILDNLTVYAIKFLEINWNQKNLQKTEHTRKKALLNLATKIEKIKENALPEEIQTIVYSVGKENGYENNLRDWFKLIYQVLFGDTDGPRMGFFINFLVCKRLLN